MKNSLCSFLLAALTFTSTVTGSTTTFNANYDDVSAGAVGLSGGGLGTYKGLTYNSFIVINNSLAVVGGVAPHSPPNNIVAVQGMNGTPSITVAPPYKTFSLKNFWFGCDADLQQGSVNAAVQCTLTVAAFQKANEQEVAVASYTFTPPENPVTQPPMVQAVLPNGFESVYMVTFIQNDPTLTGFGIDNLGYTAST